MSNWNEQQEKAIYEKDTNILISASAGSGKTSVLIARIMHLINDEAIPLDKICAVTFTEAAASEMKKRLASEINNLITKQQDIDKLKFLNEQLAALSSCNITTIDGFCFNVLKEYYYMLDINPERLDNVLDNVTRASLYNQVLDEVIKKVITNNPTSFNSLYEIFANLQDPLSEIKKIIIKFATLAQSKIDHEAFLLKCKNHYANINTFEDIPIFYRNGFFAMLKLYIERIIDICHTLLEKYKLAFLDDTDKKRIIENKVELASTCLENLDHQKYDAFISSVELMCGFVVPTAFEKDDKNYKDMREKTKALENEILSHCFSSSRLCDDMKNTLPLVEIISSLTSDFIAAFKEAKIRENLIDFNDMELYAYQILNDFPAVKQRYQNRFSCIMVDEFQDTNDIQDALINAIGLDNNIFRVGDIKQSIYGFRQATPEIMKSYMNDNSNQSLITLNTNYRSQQNLIEFTNYLFSHLMNLEGLNSTFSEADHAKGGLSSQSIAYAPITFHAILNKDLDMLSLNHLTSAEWIANYLAHNIRERKESENLQWKDFTILYRSAAHNDVLKKAFENANIPYFINITKGFYTSTAIHCIISTLEAIDNPHNDVAFLSSITSPLFNISWDDVSEYKIKKAKLSYYAYLKTINHPIIAQFQVLVNATKDYTISELISIIISTNNYYDNKTTNQERYNIDLLIQNTNTFQEKMGTSISAFLSYLDDIDTTNGEEAICNSDENDVVKIMSIHKSKGLQFPIVYIFSTKSSNSDDFNSFCIFDKDQGIALKALTLPERYQRNTVGYLSIKYASMQRSIEEEMRVLYVATTRAEKELHFVDCIDNIDTYRHTFMPSSIFDMKGFTPLVLPWFFQVNNKLVKVNVVNKLFSDQKVAPLNHSSTNIAHYELAYNPINNITPSSYAHNILPTDFNDNSLGIQYGNTMHLMCEHLDKSIVDKFTVLNLASSLKLELIEAQVKQLLDLINSKWWKEALNNECLHEVAIYAKDGNKLIHGIIDLLIITPQEIHIIDFKTDNYKIADEYINQYSTQLNQYYIAILQQFPTKTIKSYIYAFSLNELIEIPTK